MVVYVDICHICRLVPFWLPLHIVRNHLAVDGEVLETNVLHFAALVVTGDDAHVRSFSSVGDVAQGDVLDATSWGRTVLLVEAYAHVEEHTLADIVDAKATQNCTAMIAIRSWRPRGESPNEPLSTIAGVNDVL